VAKRFAGAGGIVIEVTARMTCSIKEWSVFPEEELLLLPNFKALVTRGLTEVDGWWRLSLCEIQPQVPKYIF